MIQKLLELYEQSKLNKGNPKCIFPETMIFNEGWLLRVILNRLMEVKDVKDTNLSDFLPFPKDSKIYSEGRLTTPFKPITQQDTTSTEKQTHIDGIVGDFELYETTKSGIKISDDFKYLSIFESKICSPLSSGTENEPNFDQVTRTISCMIFHIMKFENLKERKIFLVIIYPKENKKIDALKYTENDNEFIKEEIKQKLSRYKKGHEASSQELIEFESKYKEIIQNINIKFVNWEDILNEIKEDTLINEFYDLCKKFNKKIKLNKPLKIYPGTLDELLRQCPLHPQKPPTWIDKHCISKIEPPEKCITSGRKGGLPVKTSDGFYVRLSPKNDSKFWDELPN